MCPIAPRVDDIAESEDVELLLTASTCCIDWEQDWERDEAANEARYDRELEQAQEEVAVQGASSVQDVSIRELEEGANPAEQAIRQLWCALSVKRQ